MIQTTTGWSSEELEVHEELPLIAAINLRFCRLWGEINAEYFNRSEFKGQELDESIVKGMLRLRIQKEEV